MSTVRLVPVLARASARFGASALVFAAAAIPLAACSGMALGEGLEPVAGDPADAASAPPWPGESGGDADRAGPDDGGAPSDAAPSGPEVVITLEGTLGRGAPAPPGASRLTPPRQAVGVLGLVLYRTPDDPAPVRVFDRLAAGEREGVEVELVSGARREVGRARLADVPPGRYTLARVPTSHVRYTVPARLHTSPGVVLEGAFDNVQALTTGVVVDGSPRDKGWFTSTFRGGGAVLGPTTITGAPTPIASTSGGITTEATASGSAYVFPVDLVVPEQVTRDVTVRMVIDVKDDFVWQDQPTFGYLPGRLDATLLGYEPVLAFGASGFRLLVAP